jgi:hypothetical protein
MTDLPERLDLRSLDLSDKKKQDLLRLDPKSRPECGKIDFDRLKLARCEPVDQGKVNGKFREHSGLVTL